MRVLITEHRTTAQNPRQKVRLPLRWCSVWQAEEAPTLANGSLSINQHFVDLPLRGIKQAVAFLSVTNLTGQTQKFSHSMFFDYHGDTFGNTRRAQDPGSYASGGTTPFGSWDIGASRE